MNPFFRQELSGNFVFPYVFVFQKFIPSLNVITERETFPELQTIRKFSRTQQNPKLPEPQSFNPALKNSLPKSTGSISSEADRIHCPLKKIYATG